MRYADLTGKVFGRLTVIEKAPSTVTPSGHKITRWFCKCSCGNPKIQNIVAQSLVNGRSKSCGCLQAEVASLCSKKNNRYAFLPDGVIGYTSKGEKFFIDQQDYDTVSRYCWYADKDGYLTTGSGSKGTAIKLHNLILGKPEKGYVIDHINHNPKDNRRCNLRIVPLFVNCQNVGIRSTNKSGITGICWETSRNKWRVMIGYMNKKIFVGRYSLLEDAIEARKAAEKKYYGEYAYDVSSQMVPPIVDIV